MYEINITALVLLSGLLIGFNPLILGAILSLATASRGNRHSTMKIRQNGSLFLLLVGLLICAAGFFCYALLANLSQTGLQAVGFVSAWVAIIWGTLELAGLYRPKPFLHLPKSILRGLHRNSTKIITTRKITSFAKYSFVGCLLSIGAAYLCLLSTMSLVESAGIGLVVLFALCFMTPTAIVLVLASTTNKLPALTMWRNESAATLHATTGLTTIVLGWILLLLLSGIDGGL